MFYHNPPIIDERTGQRGLPGQTYNCRCTQIPYREDSPFSYDIAGRQKYERLIASAQARNSSDDVEWITVKGNHIPIKEGQTKDEAVKEFLDKKNTIAGVKKGKPMSYRKANGGRVNPNFGKKDGYDRNCQTCVAVFEARLRGYDIEAAPFDENNRAMVQLAYYTWQMYKTRSGEAPKLSAIRVTNSKDCELWLKSNLDYGKRYAFGYTRRGSSDKHIIEVKKDIFGNINFYDPQNGEHLSSKKALSDVGYRTSQNNKIVHTPPLIFRVDNTEIETEFLGDILEY